MIFITDTPAYPPSSSAIESSCNNGAITHRVSFAEGGNIRNEWLLWQQNFGA